MIKKAKKVFAHGLLAVAVGFMAWPGCATPPLPSSHARIGARQKSDFTFAKISPLSREEVVSKLGTPDVYFPDLRIAAYKVNTVTRRNVFLLLFVIPISVTHERGGYDFGLVQYDENERVTRSGMATAEAANQAVQKWQGQAKTASR